MILLGRRNPDDEPGFLPNLNGLRVPKLLGPPLCVFVGGASYEPRDFVDSPLLIQEIDPIVEHRSLPRTVRPMMRNLTAADQPYSPISTRIREKAAIRHPTGFWPLRRPIEIRKSILRGAMIYVALSSPDLD